MRTIKVHLGSRSYPIYLGTGILSHLGDLARENKAAGKVGIVTNPKVADLYLAAAEESLRCAGYETTSIVIPEGEEYKNIASLSSIYDRLIGSRFDRSASLIALGGGVVGDLTGFAAATFLRGIRYIQVPTTLLSQVDASVGGKTAINHERGKNLIGAFYQPSMVLIDLKTLRSLPPRELVAGMAEVIKYGIIEDSQFFAFLESHMESLLQLHGAAMEEAVAISCAIKAGVVEQDEREADLRAVLNFGHTIGHALESATDYTRLLHGEAVGIGMAKAAALSNAEGFCPREDLERIESLLEHAGLSKEIPPDVSLEQIMAHMEVDKKSLAGKIKFVLCHGIGKTRFEWFSPKEIIERLG